MRRAKRNAAKLLSAAMAVGMMAGMAVPAAAEEESNNIWASDVDTSEPMELKMYLIGDRTPDFDEVYGKINEILEEKLNCTLSVDFLSWGEHDTKYSLLFSGGEDFDLIFTASSWGHYEQTVALGGFSELTEEDIQTYAPGIWDVVPEMAWDQAKIDGKVYMVPNYSNEFGQDVLAVRGDLMEEYGIDEIKDWDSLMTFYKACAENGMYASQGGPWYQYFQEKGLSTLGGAPKPSVVFTEEETNTINDYLSDLKALTEEKTAHWLTDGGIEDEWDDYVSAMDSMGLQDVVAAWQAAYDRYVEAQ